jgi:hypothetical protein
MESNMEGCMFRKKYNGGLKIKLEMDNPFFSIIKRK